jgi:hypothetical protein
MRKLAILFLVTSAIAMSTSRADAGDGNTGGTVGPSGDPIVYVSGPDDDPTGTAGGSGDTVCQLYDVTGPGPWLGKGDVATPPYIEGKDYWLVCTADGKETYVNLIIYQPGTNVIDAGTLALQAYKELPLLYPRPRTAPPRTATQIVGIPTWFWVDPEDWHPLSATASVLGLSATVTAEPTKTTWKLGDGTTVTCNGPGTPYDPTIDDAAQHSDCVHAYQHDGDVDAVVAITWHVTWTASNGASGDLGNLERGTGFPVTIEQRQAVING